MGYEKPLPKINADTARFWEGCNKHRLRFRRCDSCGEAIWPPASICPACHSSKVCWTEAAGHGRVYTFAVFHVAYHPGFSGELLYVAALVELDEGPRLLTNIIGCEPADVRCGMEVEVAWEDVAAGVSLPKFRPRGSGDDVRDE